MSPPVTIVTVSYNTPELLLQLVQSLRKHYDNVIHVVDGSDSVPLQTLREYLAGVPNVYIHAQGYNIHHGPGMAWAIQHLPLSDQVLFLDSDVTVLQPGFLEDLQAHLKPQDYGVGWVIRTSTAGLSVKAEEAGVAYVHPACMLCNLSVMCEWPMPIRHGAPMIEAMNALDRAGKSGLLRHIDWVRNDFSSGGVPVFLFHRWQGTVQANGGYNLETVSHGAESDIRQLAAYDNTGIPFNADLLTLIPSGVQRLLEVGCNSGGLAAAFKRRQPGCHVVGIELREEAARVAARQCDQVFTLDVETLSDAAFAQFADRQCWVFGDVLEHLVDPWRVLRRICKVLPSDGYVVVCLPNMQHWSVQAKLATGLLFYEPGGLLDNTHLRWFTRQTALKMFDDCGYRLDVGYPRILNEPQRDAVLPHIRGMAISQGLDPNMVEADALPIQYVMRFVKK